MTELKTLKDINIETSTTHDEIAQCLLDQAELEFREKAKYIAKEHITKLCKDMNLDEKTIGAGYYNERDIFEFAYDEPRSEHNTMTAALVSWIKYFFNLE